MQCCKEFFICASSLKTGWIYSEFLLSREVFLLHLLHFIQYQQVILHSGLHSLLQSFTLSVFAYGMVPANLQQRLSVVLVFKIGFTPETLTET
ncbi:MAG: hypothetical protein D3919_01535 [Candidatus Electrothrix sp. AW5]|nr:hypothetical protein [Candidatus Electrothrix gigas]